MKNVIRHSRWILTASLMLTLGACAVTPPAKPCPAGTQELPGCPPLSAIDDPKINEIYERRTWIKGRDIETDLIELGKQAEIPVQNAAVKFLGPSPHHAIDSLAVKLWMIENAEHTIDFVYYIFKTDMVGQAMLGAMCNAVQRGVDIRVVVDSLGSISGGTHASLRALETCAQRNAGFMRNAEGQLTTRKARVQVVIFNAVSTLGNPNRRSHDKVLVKDGSFHSKSAVITGGRNISEDYYGIRGDGTPDPDPFRDAEILLRDGNIEADKMGVAEVSEHYATVLFLMPFNKRITPGSTDRDARQYWQERNRAQESLATLKSYDYFSPHMAEMDEYMSTGFHDARVRLAHELGNLSDTSVITRVEKNNQANPNSIMTLLARIADENPDIRTVRLVSPYLFLAEYRDKEGELVIDEAENFREWLRDHPDTTLEIISNSVLTSDNFSAQSIIDMETAPRLLFPPEMREAWLDLDSEQELQGELVNSEAWLEIVSHPRLKIYETGRLDSVLLGGDQNYGKLHAKYIISDEVAFVGTTNFDYRSRLYNNEMGFFVVSPPLLDEINRSFDELVAISYRWGSPEWLELRAKVIEAGGMKGSSTKRQRGLYKLFKNTGIIWLL